jgi:hypothetical protein
LALRRRAHAMAERRIVVVARGLPGPARNHRRRHVIVAARPNLVDQRLEIGVEQKCLT